MTDRTPGKRGDDELRAAIAMGGFAGLRTAEIHRLDWKDVRLSERVIIVGADKAKTASRRVAPIIDNLAAWPAPLAKSEGPIVHHSQRFLRAVANEWHTQLTLAQ
jgi:integrase